MVDIQAARAAEAAARTHCPALAHQTAISPKARVISEKSDDHRHAADATARARPRGVVAGSLTPRVSPGSADTIVPATEGRSSIGRAPVSKTGGCRFKSCRPCSSVQAKTRSAAAGFGVSGTRSIAAQGGWKPPDSGTDWRATGAQSAARLPPDGIVPCNVSPTLKGAPNARRGRTENDEADAAGRR